MVVVVSGVLTGRENKEVVWLERDSETIAPHTVNAIPISARIPARRMLFVGLILRERKR